MILLYFEKTEHHKYVMKENFHLNLNFLNLKLRNLNQLGLTLAFLQVKNKNQCLHRVPRPE